MAIRIQLRRDTAANWTSANPALLAGELGIETDTNKIKIGNGSNWNSIASYLNVTPGDLTSQLGDYILVSDMGQPNGVATLDSTGKIPVAQLGNLIDSAPAALNTLNELAAALNDDANFATTITTLITNTGTTAATDATNKANDAVSTSNSYTDNAISSLHTTVSGEISTHSSDTTNVHGIVDTSLLATKLYADTELSTHNLDTTNIHGIADTNQLATKEYADNAVATHNSYTGGVHGIEDVLELATKTYANSAASSVQSQLTNYAPKSGATFTGTVIVPTLNATDIVISGNLTVEGTTTTVSSVDLEITDPLIYIGKGNSANINDLGLVAHFDDGTYQHTGIVRDATDGKWKLFSGVTTEPGTTIDFSVWTKDTLVIGALEATSAAIGDVTNTELQYVHGVTSAIQTQIDSKSPSDSPVFTNNAAFGGQVRISSTGSYVFSDGSATSPSSGSVLLSRKSDGSGLKYNAGGTDKNIASETYVNDAIDTFDPVPSVTPISQKTANYTLSSVSEKDTTIEFNSSSAVVLTIPTDLSVAFPVGSSLDILNINTGLVTIAGDSGVTVNATPGLKLRTQWSSATLFKRGSNNWVVYGDLKA